MFTLKRTRITSDEGFTIEFDHSRLVYKTDRHVIALNHEMLPARKSVAIWRDSLRSADRTGVDQILQTEREAILNDVVRAFSGVGYKVEIIG